MAARLPGGRARKTPQAPAARWRSAPPRRRQSHGCIAAADAAVMLLTMRMLKRRAARPLAALPRCPGSRTWLPLGPTRTVAARKTNIVLNISTACLHRLPVHKPRLPTAAAWCKPTKRPLQRRRNAPLGLLLEPSGKEGEGRGGDGEEAPHSGVAAAAAASPTCRHAAFSVASRAEKEGAAERGSLCRCACALCRSTWPWLLSRAALGEAALPQADRHKVTQLAQGASCKACLATKPAIPLRTVWDSLPQAPAAATHSPATRFQAHSSQVACIPCPKPKLQDLADNPRVCV